MHQLKTTSLSTDCQARCQWSVNQLLTDDCVVGFPFINLHVQLFRNGTTFKFMNPNGVAELCNGWIFIVNASCYSPHS